MIAIALLFLRSLCDCFKSRRRLEAEILVLRHQLNVLRQRAPRRLHLRWADRALFVWLYRHFPRILDAITIVRPETVVRWHRMGFAAYWRWKSRPLGGRPWIRKEVRDFIRRMSFENPLWGAPKIHGELLKIGIDVAQSTVSKYMVPRQGRPLQTWKTFLRNHAEGIASIDLFVVPTVRFEQLFAFLVLGHGRRRLIWYAVTAHPTAEWLVRQITEAFPWDTVPRYLIRDNDRAYGSAFKARVRAMGIRDRPTSFRSPWQNGYVERLIGSIRRECTGGCHCSGLDSTSIPRRVLDTRERNAFQANLATREAANEGGLYLNFAIAFALAWATGRGSSFAARCKKPCVQLSCDVRITRRTAAYVVVAPSDIEASGACANSGQKIELFASSRVEEGADRRDCFIRANAEIPCATNASNSTKRSSTIENWHRPFPTG